MFFLPGVDDPDKGREGHQRSHAYRSLPTICGRRLLRGSAYGPNGMVNDGPLNWLIMVDNGQSWTINNV